jgi:hypothetical protein
MGSITMSLPDGRAAMRARRLIDRLSRRIDGAEHGAAQTSTLASVSFSRTASCLSNCTKIGRIVRVFSATMICPVSER